MRLLCAINLSLILMTASIFVISNNHLNKYTGKTYKAKVIQKASSVDIGKYRLYSKDQMKLEWENGSKTVVNVTPLTYDNFDIGDYWIVSGIPKNYVSGISDNCSYPDVLSDSEKRFYKFRFIMLGITICVLSLSIIWVFFSNLDA